jgi:hypothetical protein
MQTNLARSLLFLAFVGLTAEAQEASNDAAQAQIQAAEIEALEPGLSSEQLSATDALSDDEGLQDELAAEREAIEPTAVLAQDVRRRENSNGVMDEIDLGRTEITGNQELPKVLYIVPWQNSAPGEMTGRPVNTLIDEVLAPIDRSEFIRQVEYYDDLNGEQE